MQESIEAYCKNACKVGNKKPSNQNKKSSMGNSKSNQHETNLTPSNLNETWWGGLVYVETKSHKIFRSVRQIVFEILPFEVCWQVSILGPLAITNVHLTFDVIDVEQYHLHIL